MLTSTKFDPQLIETKRKKWYNAITTTSMSTVTTSPFSILMKVLKLLKKDISSQLNDIFNLLVTTGVFPTNLKTAKYYICQI